MDEEKGMTYADYRRNRLRELAKVDITHVRRLGGLAEDGNQLARNAVAAGISPLRFVTVR